MDTLTIVLIIFVGALFFWSIILSAAVAKLEDSIYLSRKMVVRLAYALGGKVDGAGVSIECYPTDIRALKSDVLDNAKLLKDLAKVLGYEYVQEVHSYNIIPASWKKMKGKN